MDLLNEFLNRVFNNLNWTITEFGVSAKEFQGSLSKQFSSELQQFQRKCNVMFDLSVNLLQILEFVAKEVPSSFLDQEMNLTRLSELLLFVLNRTTAGPDDKNFDNLLKLEMIGLDKISRLSILGPMVGIILNLCSCSTSQMLVRSIASTAGFNVNAFQFLCSFGWHQAIVKELGSELNQNDLNLMNEQLLGLSKFVEDLEKEVHKERDDQNEIARSSSAEFCSICYAAPIDTRFEPCKHQSCNRCIKRHLLNSNKCFYCNTEIESITLEK